MYTYIRKRCCRIETTGNRPNLPKWAYNKKAIACFYVLKIPIDKYFMNKDIIYEIFKSFRHAPYTPTSSNTVYDYK